MDCTAPEIAERIALTRRPNEHVVMRQNWRTLLFLHWRVDPAAIQATLPPGLTVDTFDGAAYIGLVPFTMRDVRPVWSPSVPWLSHFHETNVRTYVHKGGKNPGVWFYSLDAANPIAVLLARSLWKLPYHFAKMELRSKEGVIEYRSERRWPPPVPGVCSVDCSITGTPRASEPGTLEFFLAERYLLYAFAGGRLMSGQVHHTPYPLQTAKVNRLDETLIRAAGLDDARASGGDTEPLAHYASGVDVDIFGLRRL
jgi:uncharacterized protein YqjF (DUF2071 family)